MAPRSSLPECLRRFGERAWKRNITEAGEEDISKNVEAREDEAEDREGRSVFRRLSLRIAVVAATLAGAAGLLCVAWLELALYASSKGYMDPEGPMEPAICLPLVYAGAININVSRWEKHFLCEYDVIVDKIVYVTGDEEDAPGEPLP